MFAIARDLHLGDFCVYFIFVVWYFWYCFLYFWGFFIIYILLYILWQYQRYCPSFSYPTNRLGYFFRLFFIGSASNEFLPFYTLPSLLPLRTHYTFSVHALIIPFLYTHSFYLFCTCTHFTFSARALILPFFVRALIPFLYAHSFKFYCNRTHFTVLVRALILQFLLCALILSFLYLHSFYLPCTPALILSFLSIVISASWNKN